MKTLVPITAWLGLILTAAAQDAPPSPWSQDNFTGLAFRGIGPAFMSGRIADIAMHPGDENTWFIAVGSGGVWKTVNAGVTWSPVFDDQSSYSIGCVTIDPRRPHTVWVGTGENVGGRHVGFGDGVYKSVDGGATWTHKGLRDSEHISKVVVHPDDSKVVWVAAQGPLWRSGGDRGVYKSVDGGANWQLVLGGNPWVGATDLLIDPRDPDVLYAATWQRHRTVAAYLGGGPGSGIHKSVDGGVTWARVTSGLPESSMGKIGLAISPQQPDVLYAAIELDRRRGGVYRSADGGASWEKRSDAVSGGTGPHYYQELYASPHRFDRIYLADVRIQVSEDGGKTFMRLPEQHKHSDNHAMAFRPSDPDYLLVGSDGGLYESFDLGRNWRFMDNLPVTQFYKVALDDAEPFFNIYGGTQDNSTEGGPSRTDNAHGIQNSDWRVVLDWDGHQPATEPGNPNIVYAERQEGTLSRVDMSTGEVVDIQPQPGDGEDYERFNWDAPILVSPHDPARIYFASQRVWRSDNRGDRWAAISGDLTRDQDRLSLPIMGDTQSWDNAWDVLAMSNFNTITSLAESPLTEGLLYAGTDDGLIQVTENGGADWRAVEVSTLPGTPRTAFINHVVADRFDADTVYVALDDHKSGDLSPYLVKSDDRGRTWRSIRGDLPERTLVWRLAQDHRRRDLLFLATEFGVYFTVNGGERWTKLTGGVPTISFRDLAIHSRDDDLVAASFGRGFYVFDDIDVFRHIDADQLAREGTLFPVRKAWWYFERPQLGFAGGRGDQGASHFVAPNPPFGAVFTYYLRDGFKDRRSIRREAEQELRESASSPVAFPGWEAVEMERRESPPRVWLTIQDAAGDVVRRVPGPADKGFHRVSWDLRYPSPAAVSIDEEPAPVGEEEPVRGLMAAPGEYRVSMSAVVDGEIRALSEPQVFRVVPLRSGGALPGADPGAVAAFWRDYESTVRLHLALQSAVASLLKKVDRMADVISESRAGVGELDRRLAALRRGVLDLDRSLSGVKSKQEVGEKTAPTINDRLFAVGRGVDRSTYGPTETHRRTLAIAKVEMRRLRDQAERLRQEQGSLAAALLAAGAPWIEGEPLPAGNR